MLKFHEKLFLLYILSGVTEQPKEKYRRCLFGDFVCSHFLCVSEIAPSKIFGKQPYSSNIAARSLAGGGRVGKATVGCGSEWTRACVAGTPLCLVCTVVFCGFLELPAPVSRSSSQQAPADSALLPLFSWFMVTRSPCQSIGTFPPLSAWTFIFFFCGWLQGDKENCILISLFIFVLNPFFLL